MEGVLYANPNLTEHNLSLSSTLIHLFLVNYDYLKFLEMLTMWEKKRSRAFPVSFLIWMWGEKTESYRSYLFYKNNLYLFPKESELYYVDLAMVYKIVLRMHMYYISSLRLNRAKMTTQRLLFCALMYFGGIFGH